jgi:uncharacterized protein
MICSFCDTKMLASEREGIAIHYCPQCGGIWLRRGALEGIIARISPVASQERNATQGGDRNDHEEDGDDRSPPWDGRQWRPEDQEKRGGRLREMLGNLFDFG